MKVFSKVLGVSVCVFGLANAGFYAGVQGGYAFANTNFKTDYSANISDGVFQGTSVHLNGISGGLHFGYEHLFSSCYVLGVELSGQVQDASKKTEHKFAVAPIVTNSFNIKHTMSAAALIKAGYQRYGYTPYLKVGPAFGKWKFSAVGDDGTLLAVNNSKVRPGVRIGLGVDLKATEKFVWGFEYHHTFYKNYTVTQPDTNVAPDDSHRVKPQSGAVMLHISYKL